LLEELFLVFGLQFLEKKSFLLIPEFYDILFL